MEISKKLKKGLAFALVLMMTLPNIVFGQTMNDYKGHWAEKSIESWIDKGYIRGYEDGTFKPDNDITRAEFISIVNRSFEFTKETAVDYKDVKESHWAYNEFKRAKGANYIAGFEDGTLRPNSKITKQEVAAIISRLMGLDTSKKNDILLDLEDSSKIPEWSAGAISAVLSNGYMKVTGDNFFLPAKPATRAEVVDALNKSYLGFVKVRYNESGTYAPALIDGSVEINVKDVTLEDTVINGNLIISEGVGNDDVMLRNVVIKGDTILRGGGSGSSDVITETHHVSAISVVQTTMTLTAGGSTGTVTKTVSPAFATNQNVTWSSSDTDVATVVGGVVTPKAAGTAIITVTSVTDGSKTAHCTVIVEEPVVEEPEVEEPEVEEPVVEEPEVEEPVAEEPVVEEPVVATVNLGMAGDYAILTKTGISSVPNSDITGNIGVSPIDSTAITGFALVLDATNEFAISSQITGKAYATDYAAPTPSNLTTAVSNMETAYTDAAGRAASYTELHTGDISGQTLTPGVYKWGTGVLINSDVTLSGGADDVWIFQIAKGITQSSDTKIILSGGAQAKNIFWQSAEGVVIGANAHFEGNILCMKDIALSANASINGRLMAQTAVTLISNTVVAP